MSHLGGDEESRLTDRGDANTVQTFGPDLRKTLRNPDVSSERWRIYIRTEGSWTGEGKGLKDLGPSARNAPPQHRRASPSTENRTD